MTIRELDHVLGVFSVMKLGNEFTQLLCKRLEKEKCERLKENYMKFETKVVIFQT